MSLSIADAYKNKEYGWFGAYIAIIVISVKLAGVVGVIGSFLILSGLYKTVKNPEYSQKKKILLSSTYVIVGTILTAAALYALSTVLTKVTTDPATVEIVGSTDSYFLQTSTDTSVNLEKELYVNTENNFQIKQPIGWAADYSDPQMIVQFNTPSPDKIGVITIASDGGMGRYSSKDYAAGTMQGFTDVGAKDVKIIAQGGVSVNGEQAYVVEFEYTHTIPDFGDLSMHAVSASFVHKDRGYNILAVTQVETWSEYNALLNDSISTFQFLQ